MLSRPRQDRISRPVPACRYGCRRRADNPRDKRTRKGMYIRRLRCGRGDKHGFALPLPSHTRHRMRMLYPRKVKRGLWAQPAGYRTHEGQDRPYYHRGYRRYRRCGGGICTICRDRYGRDRPPFLPRNASRRRGGCQSAPQRQQIPLFAACRGRRGVQAALCARRQRGAYT